MLTLLSAVGTAAMIWVGGGIIVHGLEVYGLHAIGAAIHHVAEAAAHALPAIAGAVEWIVAAAGAGIVGLAIGAVLIPVMEFAVAPAWRSVKSATGAARRAAFARTTRAGRLCAAVSSTGSLYQRVVNGPVDRALASVSRVSHFTLLVP